MKSELVTHGALVVRRPRILDYITLTKPELTSLSVLTALGGYYLGAAGQLHAATLLHVLFGTLFLGGGLGALNQFLERDFDAVMRRTENRPLPAGRIAPSEALLFGTFLVLVGFVELVFFTKPLTALFAFFTVVTYLFLYTPLKRVTWTSTIVGGIPGALPPVIGFTAARNQLTMEAWVLFGILFFWQMPHFFSLAWMYRRDYERAGYPMLTVLDAEGTRTARHILFWCIALIPISLLLTIFGELGWTYAVGAVLIGAAYLYTAFELMRTKSNVAARKLFFLSLLYLPVLLAFMLVDKL